MVFHVNTKVKKPINFTGIVTWSSTTKATENMNEECQQPSTAPDTHIFLWSVGNPNMLLLLLQPNVVHAGEEGTKI